MSYVWNSKNLKFKQHLLRSNGLTYCSAEKSPTNLDTISDKPHARKRICKICKTLKEKPLRRKKKKLKKNKKPCFYLSWEWKKVRYNILKKYGPICMLCGSDNRIVVDHIKPRSKYPNLELDENNLQVLCNDCNMGKSNDDQTDFRPNEPRLSVLMGERME